jgi:hypothetical protein
MRFEKKSGAVRQLALAAGVVLLSAGLGGCGSSSGPKQSAGTAGTTGTAGGGSGSAGSSASGSTGMAGGGSGNAGTSGTAGGGSGTSGTSGNAGASGSSGGGTAGAGNAGAGGNVGSTGVAGAGGATGVAGATGAGGGMTMFSDDFEEYKIQGAFNCPAPNGLCDFTPMGSTTPTWLGYHFHGPPYVVAAMVFGGKQVYQLDTEGGHAVAADIIKEAPDGTDLWPAAHYGRVMVKLAGTGLPATGSAGIMTESGLLPGSTTDTAQYTLGGTDGKLSFSYMQRKRPFKNDVSTPTKRIGGNWENASEAPTTYCTVTATAATIMAGKWVCVEWMIDKSKPELHVWLDGATQSSLDVSGGGGTCSAGTAPTWTGPEHFTELDLGWEINGNDAGGRGAQYDMFAIGTQRLGCPMQ